jgi:hypothetical protein
LECTSRHSGPGNPVLNDLFALAQYPTETILNSAGFNIFVSDDFSMVKTLLIEQRRSVLVVMEVSANTEAETRVLLQLKMHRF